MTEMDPEMKKIEAALKFLEIMEREEARLLSWGLTDGYFTSDELTETAREYLIDNEYNAIFGSPEAFIIYLNKELKFIFSFRNNVRCKDEYKNVTCYRSRMAEGIRLFSYLRQLFHGKHDKGASWRAAPTLTAGFRFIKRPRYYPKRNIIALQAIEEIKKNNNISALQEAILKDILKMNSGKDLALAKFQLDSACSILRALGEKYSSGTIISAGTGSGKTIAFYLPAMLHIAERIKINSDPFTKCLAVYPRTELLKDQFSETYKQARLLDSALTGAKIRKIVIGTYFRGTPTFWDLTNSKLESRGWEKNGDSYACPLIVCPDCSKPLLWKKEDYSNRTERLTCSDETCGKIIGQDEILLTRDSMMRNPPDILFTTTEMLNQRLSDSDSNKIFGLHLSADKKPALVLLDEVHTYEGVHAAQVAMLLRRWRRAAGCYPHFVGLSATLKEASLFFSGLTGIESSKITSIAPEPKEITSEGSEYMLVLKGDPASKTQLLSTTVQTAMLGKRLLNPRNSSPETLDKIFGQKVFLFTDDLDVTNRLYHILLEAEGKTKYGKNNPYKKPLASIRQPAARRNNDDGRNRFFNGQIWSLPELIGYKLDDDERLNIGRTSSQDSGVMKDGDVIVASASLEVGYNDNQVGMVIQHKSPRQNAQFLQRKGRAGRDRLMRPWTIIVLSDFGRDRINYQGYEFLFDPELEPIDIPVSNKYVLKMQCVYAFIDWLSFKNKGQGSVWLDLSGFRDTQQNNIINRYQNYLGIVKDILAAGNYYKEFKSYLKSALLIDEDTAESLLWEPPRALMTTVLPTLCRRLESCWKKDNKDRNDSIVINNPLPEFIPKSLFSDLNLPEIIIEYSNASSNEQSSMPVLQGMREFAPGRVSKRFGINDKTGQGVFPGNLDPESTKKLDINVISPDKNYDILGDFDYRDEVGNLKSIQCYRLNRIKTKKIPHDLKEYSNAFLDWKTQIIEESKGASLEIPKASKWKNIFESILFYTHNAHSPVEIRRFALGSKARLAFKDIEPFDTYIQFMNGEAPAAIGFVLDVDGIMFRIKIPENLRLRYNSESKAKLHALRSDFFLSTIQDSPELNTITDRFERDWIAQIYLSSLVCTALDSGESLNGLVQKLKSGKQELNYQEVLLTIFRGSVGLENETSADDGQMGDRQAELLALLKDPFILNVLYEKSCILWSDPDDQWKEWIENKYLSTLGGGILEAISSLCPEITINDLILDIRNEDSFAEIWITETVIGGGGVIERFLARYNEDPRCFFELLDTAFQPSDYEMMDPQLFTILKWIKENTDKELSGYIKEIREPESHSTLISALNKLKTKLVKNGIIASHPVIASINNRILRPGSNKDTDILLYELIKDWHDKEDEIGIEVDARIFAYIKSRDHSLDQALNIYNTEGKLSASEYLYWKYELIYSMLWPRGSMVRSQSLDLYNPYASLPKTERLLVADSVEEIPVPVVEVSSSDWKEKFIIEILKSGEAVLRFNSGAAQLSKNYINSLIAEPIDAHGLFYYPNIKRIFRHDNILDIFWEIREII